MVTNSISFNNIIPGTIWISGVTASGKSTYAEMLMSELNKLSIKRIKLFLALIFYLFYFSYFLDIMLKIPYKLGSSRKRNVKIGSKYWSENEN